MTNKRMVSICRRRLLPGLLAVWLAAISAPLQTAFAAEDTAPPEKPAGSSWVSPAFDRVELTWQAPSGEVPAKYVIHRNGTAVAETNSLSFTDTGLAERSSIAYEIFSVDAAGNKSVASAVYAGTANAGVITVSRPEFAYSDSAALSADGFIAAYTESVPVEAGGFKSTLLFRNMKTGEISSISPSPYDERISKISLNRNGRLAAYSASPTSNHVPTAYVLHTDTGVLDTVNTVGSDVEVLRISDSGDAVFYRSVVADAVNVYRWNQADRSSTLLYTMPFPSRRVDTKIVSEDESTLVFVMTGLDPSIYNSTVFLFDLASNTPNKEPTVISTTADSPSVNADGTLVAYRHESGINVYDRKTGQSTLLRAQAEFGPIYYSDPILSADGSRVALHVRDSNPPIHFALDRDYLEVIGVQTQLSEKVGNPASYIGNYAMNGDGSKLIFENENTTGRDANGNFPLGLFEVCKGSCNQSVMLSGITVHAGQLTPAFSTDVFSYKVNVEYGVTSLKLGLTTADHEAAITVNGEPVPNSEFTLGNLQVGSNLASVTVRLPDGLTKTYNVSVIRAEPPLESNAKLKSLSASTSTITPSFEPDKTNYTLKVRQGTSRIELTPVPVNDSSKIEVEGTVVTGGAPFAVDFSGTEKTVPIQVTSPGGTKNTYTVTIKNASSNAYLKPIAVGNGYTLSPAFSPTVHSYAVEYSGTPNVSVTVSAEDSLAKMTIAGVDYKDGAAYTGVLNSQHPSLSVLVTAEDGSLNTYNLSLRSRVPTPSPSGGSSGGGTLSSNTDLSSLKLDNIAFVPSFDPAVKEYRAEVDASTKEVKLSFSGSFGQSFTINGANATGTSQLIALHDGENRIEIVVTAQDGYTKRTYTVTVVRKAAVPIPKPAVAFSDITGHWAETAIQDAFASGDINGYPDGTFRPDQSVNRAEFFVMLGRTLHWKEAAEELTFTDAASIPSWSRKYIGFGFANKWISGYPDGTIGPIRNISRSETAVILANVLHLKIEPITATDFKDDADIPAWAKPSIAAVKKAGIMIGDDNGCFRPNAPLSRAEAAVLLNAIR